MKVENFDLQMFSDHYQEKVQLNERLETVETKEADSTSSPVSSDVTTTLRRFSQEEMAFHKKVISQLLLRLRDATVQTEFVTDKTQQTRYGEESTVVEKGQVIDSDSPANPLPRQIRRVQERTRVFERETVEFSTKGYVKTDKRSIAVDVGFRVSRNLVSDRVAKQLILRDPLVINYNTTLASLSENKFRFDIDSDGLDDQISLLKRGSGFLALDRNGDGRINNGKELFGTESGNGFDDLKIYDTDGNGWIDENDPMFEKLRIWVKNDTGEDRLIALGEVGIGAIYLGNAETLFNMTDPTNETTLGMLKHSGIFLKENGDVGIVQNIELAVEAAQEEAPQYKAMDKNAFRSDFSEYEVSDNTKADKIFQAPEDATKAVQNTKEKQADLRRELKQLQSHLKHLVDESEQQKIKAKIDQLKARLSAAEGYEIQQLFNALG